jgi:sec-independent protein translocase protein TatC
VLGAVLSPGGDVVSQLLMAGPMTVLYVLSIGIAFVFGKRKPREDA